MMHRRSVLVALALAPVAVHAVPKPLRVVSSFSVLADLTQQVGGSLVAADSLVGADGDVHVYDPRPKDLRAVMSSNLIVRNGLGLEGWMDRLIDAAGFKGTIVTASEKVTPRTMLEQGEARRGDATVVDPHAWQDPRNGMLYAQAISDGLCSADPANAAAYRGAAARYRTTIAGLDGWIAAELAAIPPERRRIITTHDAFGYYGVRYGVEFLAAEGISTESEPSAKSISALVRQIKREKVGAVFIENMTSPRIAKMLARETGAVLGGTVYSDALSPPQGPAASYLEMLRYNTTLFARAMRSVA